MNETVRIRPRGLTRSTIANWTVFGIVAVSFSLAAGARLGPWMRQASPKYAYSSGGKTIEVERFAPGGAGKHPAIVFIHGADGLAMPAINAVYRRQCTELARAGNVVFLVHYMDRVGGKPGVNLAGNFIHFREYMETIRDGVTYAGAQPDVDPNRIGVCGLSLGASLAMATAIYDSRIKAVVEFFGLLPPRMAAGINKMAPVLILHGERDPLVNVSAAYSAEKAFKESGVEYEMKIYPEQGHGFVGADERDSLRLAEAFFSKHLK